MNFRSIDLKAAYVLVAIGLMALIPAQGAYTNITLWHYNASLDFGEKHITIGPMAVSSDTNSISRSIRITGDNASDWASVTQYEGRNPTAPGMEEMLWILMKPSCKRVWINEDYVGDRYGLVATGDARVEHGFGQVCYGGMVPLTTGGEGTNQYFAIIAHFLNETLNEQVVRTARLSYAAEPESIAAAA
ncbi:MAG: hypothetical protein GKC10_05360 [Methanosarcinales archaeon]|nr:hypothetical protein [Methanosarcinales archaeon]